MLVLLIGGGIALLGLSHWDLLNFAGLIEDSKSAISTSFVTSGVYSFTRHPVYLGSMIALFGLYIFAPYDRNLGYLIGISSYFIVGSIFEEWKLKSVFSEYTSYKLNVGRFFPSNIRQLKYFIKQFKNL